MQWWHILLLAFTGFLWVFTFNVLGIIYSSQGKLLGLFYFLLGLNLIGLILGLHWIYDDWKNNKCLKEKNNEKK